MKRNGSKQMILFLDKALELYRSGVNKSQISKRISQPYTTICYWIDNFAVDNDQLLHDMNKDNIQIHIDDEEAAKVLKDKDLQIEKLKKALEEETLRADAYDEMIDVAESAYKISIRKKAGAKQ